MASPNQKGILGERTARGANRFSLEELERQLNALGVTLNDVLRSKWIDTREQIVMQLGCSEPLADRITRDIFASVPVSMR